MLEFIKMFLLGIFYTLISPLILLFFLLFVVYSLGNYLVCEVINLSGFFLGKRFVAETDLEKTMARARKKKREEAEMKENQEVISEVKDGDLHE